MRYVFIPSRVSDNRILLDKDPGYVDRLYLSGSPELVKAWLFGDWNITVGAYFPEFGQQPHYCPVQLPDHWIDSEQSTRLGVHRPFSVGWYAVSDGTISIFGKNTLIKYREWYGASAPNVGLKMTAGEVAQGIVARTPVPRRSSTPWPILQCSIRTAALLWPKLCPQRRRTQTSRQTPHPWLERVARQAQRSGGQARHPILRHLSRNYSHPSGAAA